MLIRNRVITKASAHRHIHSPKRTGYISGSGPAGGGGGGRCGPGGHRGGNLGVKLLVPEGGAAVAEGPHALPALGDVEGAPGAGVAHGDLPQAVPAAAPLQLLPVMVLCRRKEASVRRRDGKWIRGTGKA